MTRWQKSQYALDKETKERNHALMQKWRDDEERRAGSSRCPSCGILFGFNNICEKCGEIQE